MIDKIIDYNKTFVEQKGYEKYITDKYPDKKLADCGNIRAGRERDYGCRSLSLWSLPHELRPFPPRDDCPWRDG